MNKYIVAAAPFTVFIATWGLLMVVADAIWWGESYDTNTLMVLALFTGWLPSYILSYITKKKLKILFADELD